MTHYTNMSVPLQEISSLVGQPREESSEAVAMDTAADEGDEPMQTDSQAEDVMSSAAAVLHVHVEGGDTAAQVRRPHTHTCTNTHLQAADWLVPTLRWRPQTVVFLGS